MLRLWAPAVAHTALPKIFSKRSAAFLYDRQKVWQKVGRRSKASREAQRAIWMKLGLPGRAFLQKGACQQHSVQTQRMHYVLHALMRHQGTMLDAEAYQRNVCIVFCTH
jgi:hypothetical protein